jgi:hypothetical protein
MTDKNETALDAMAGVTEKDSGQVTMSASTLTSQ